MLDSYLLIVKDIAPVYAEGYPLTLAEFKDRKAYSYKGILQPFAC